jgi:DMSO/TMAO reductase YedYZ molybdopterin-dependent catalytic subunit
VRRRELIAAAARLGVTSVAAVLVPRGAWTQAVADKDPRLVSRAVRPPDFETPVELLDSFLTPPELFFVRNHMQPPQVDESVWTLAIDGDAASAATMTLADLRRLPTTSVTMTLECAGNGRAFFDPPVAGIQWRKGAVGTARWTGARLADLLERTGVRSTATHVWMAAADRPFGSQPPFVRQIPIDKARHRDTVIAYAMNDRPIPRVNGAPLRMIVPGWEGAYSVKWLNRLTVSTRAHDGFWVASSYRYPTMAVAPGATVNVRDTAPLQGLVVKSLITRPADGALVVPGRLAIAGYAWAGEAGIARVDVSIDGASWQRARLTGPALAYTWRRFECDVDLKREGVHTILSRATDTRGAAQPTTPQWNPSGYLWNAPDQIRIEAAAVSSRRPGVTPGAGPGRAPTEASGDGGETVYRAGCRACHADDLVEQQRLTEAGWGRTVDKMIQWGAPVKPEQKPSLVAYLMSRWNPR